MFIWKIVRININVMGLINSKFVNPSNVSIEDLGIYFLKSNKIKDGITIIKIHRDIDNHNLFEIVWKNNLNDSWIDERSCNLFINKIEIINNEEIINTFFNGFSLKFFSKDSCSFFLSSEFQREYTGSININERISTTSK